MANEENYKTVKWLLYSLNLCEYTHVSIREHLPRSINYLGGGKPGDMIQRFGDRVVLDSCIYDNILCLYVVPDPQSDHWGDFCSVGNGGFGGYCACTGSCSSCSHPTDGQTCPIQ